MLNMALCLANVAFFYEMDCGSSFLLLWTAGDFFQLCCSIGYCGFGEVSGVI